jgi:hypothetical protein
MADEKKPVKALAENAHRHSASVASSPRALDDQAFVGAISELMRLSPPRGRRQRSGCIAQVANSMIATMPSSFSLAGDCAALIRGPFADRNRPRQT